MPSGRVRYWSSVATSSGQKKLSQFHMKMKIASDESAVLLIGSTIAEEDARLAAAVEPGGVEQVVRDRQHVLAHQEDAEGAGPGRDDQAPGRNRPSRDRARP